MKLPWATLLGMTDLLRPSAPPRTSAPGGSRRPLALSAVVAGAAAPGSLLLVCWAVGLVGWFASDGGSHGTTRTVLRLGADAWLLAHGAHLHTVDATLTAAPLGLTLLSGYLAFRFGRWAAATSECDDLRSVGLGTVSLAGTYAVVALVTAVLATVPGVEPSLGRAFLGGAVVGGLGGGAGLLAGAGLLDEAWSRLPVAARSTLLAAVAMGLTTFAAGAVLVTVALARHGSAAANVMAELHADTTGGLLSVLLVALVAPNVSLLAGAYLLGPGFAVGTATVVSPAEVVLGPVPAVPILAALPSEGLGPVWAGILFAVPTLVGVLGAWLAARTHPTRSWAGGALRGAGGGVLGAFLLTLAVTAAGGAIGSGRMAELGAPVLEVLVVALTMFGGGGLVGGLAAVGWRRRTVAEEDEPDETGSESGRETGHDDVTEAIDLGTEETVRIRRPGPSE